MPLPAAPVQDRSGSSPQQVSPLSIKREALSLSVPSRRPPVLRANASCFLALSLRGGPWGCGARYRDVLRYSKLFVWKNEGGQEW